MSLENIKNAIFTMIKIGYCVILPNASVIYSYAIIFMFFT